MVTIAELDRRVETLGALYGVQPPHDDQNRMDEFQRDAAKSFAVRIVLQDVARAEGLHIPDTAARKTLGEHIATQFGPGKGGRDDFVNALGNVGSTEREVLDEIKQQILLGKLFDRVANGVTVEDAELKEAFPRYAERLGAPEKRRLSNIVLSSRDQATKIAGQVRDGTDFAGLARANSIDGSTAERGGDLGDVAEAQLESEYAKAAFTAKKGDVFGLVRSEHGWNVGLVASVTPAKTPPFGKVKAQLRALVMFDKQLARWQDWLTDAVEEAGVRYADAYQPANETAVPDGARPDAPPPAGGSGGGR